MIAAGFPQHGSEGLCARGLKTGLALDGILVQRLVQLVHTNGPGRIRLDLLREKLALALIPERRIDESHVSRQLVRADEFRNVDVTRFKAQL
ncbi:hypothetical protein ALISP_7267 [Alicycliphilus sp. B1]|nr:hypothetical protein ALISP_7267 [Alicycliphilus sp. B1]